MDERECIYAAALFDSHGNVVVDDLGRLSYAGCFPIVILTWLQSRWGGGIVNTVVGSPSYRWRIRGRATRSFVQDVAPFVVRRVLVAQAVITLRRHELRARLQEITANEAKSDAQWMERLRAERRKDHG